MALQASGSLFSLVSILNTINSAVALRIVVAHAEICTLSAALDKLLGELYAKHDTNGDGELDLEEFTKVRRYPS